MVEEMKIQAKEIIEDYQKELLPLIKDHITNRSLFDVGCGNGLNSYFFNKKLGAKITLLDIEDIRDHEVTSFPFFESSIEKLPFKTNAFEVIYLQFVLHHLPTNIKLNEQLYHNFVSKRTFIYN